MCKINILLGIYDFAPTLLCETTESEALWGWYTLVLLMDLGCNRIENIYWYNLLETDNKSSKEVLKPINWINNILKYGIWLTLVQDKYHKGDVRGERVSIFSLIFSIVVSSFWYSTETLGPSFEYFFIVILGSELYRCTTISFFYVISTLLRKLITKMIQAFIWISYNLWSLQKQTPIKKSGCGKN